MRDRLAAGAPLTTGRELVSAPSTLAQRTTLLPPRFGTSAITATGWGWLPLLSVTAASGLLLIALGYTFSRNGMPLAELLFWLGLIALSAPIAARLLTSGATRGERIGLVLVLGLALYGVKVLHDPLYFTFSDEFAQWRNVTEILTTGHLFNPNPLLPVTAFYPGLQTVTSTVSSVTGLPIFESGVVVLGAGRLVLLLGLFLFVEQASASPRLAGIATLIYMANPNFVYFGGQVAYESLALPFAMLALFLVVRRQSAAPSARVGLTLAALMAVGATVVTHHLTSIALAGLLVLWTVAAFVVRSRRDRGIGPGGIALMTCVAAIAWSLYVASAMVGYLAPVLGNAIGEFFELISGEGGGRQFFVSGGGQAAPAWEQLTGFGAVGLILLALPFGWYQIVRHHRRAVLFVALGVASLAYPGALGLRLTAAGAETSNRSSEFLFLPIGFVLATAVVGLWLRRTVNRPRIALFTALATAIFLGGVIVGWPTWGRLPGPYLVGGDTRAVENQGIEVAEWAREHLGPGNRFVSDRTNRLLLGTYGQQRPVTGYGDLIDTKALIFRSTIGETERGIVRNGRVRYLLIDRRLSEGLPAAGIYVERGELRDIGRHTEPLELSRLAKYDSMEGVDRIFDSGDIQIYDVRSLAGGS
ncbi:MAG: hypothetical protein H0V12_06155 [Chloroflexi bacterium]|nr:hypothetical protein [Chloroflexota bacterium]